MKPLKILFLVVLALGLVAVVGCGPSAPPDEKAEPEPAAEAPAEEPAAEVPAEEPAPEEAPAAPPKAEPKAKAEPPKKPAGAPVVVMETSLGTMKIQLNLDKAPATVKNFLQYVDDGFYDGTVFHRVKPRFMIQGGGLTPDMKLKSTRAMIKNESDNGLANLRGTIAMARTSDPHSATSQFFINHVSDQAFLNKHGEGSDGWGYCVFGKVVEGIDVVDKIAAVKTGNKAGRADVPVEPVVIKSVRRAS